MGILSRIDFIRDEISTIPGIDEDPSGGVACFSSRIGYAIWLTLKEKEIILFSLLQWVSVGIGYLLWIQMFSWIPEETWEQARVAAETGEGSVIDAVLLIWGFFCIGIAAFPIGIFTGCMGAAHFLHKQGRESTIATCLKLVLPQSWALWSFHWIDGFITVRQIIKRSDRHRNPAKAVFEETLYYAWKLGICGVLPSIVTGNNLISSARRSVSFVKDNFIEVAKLRAGYSALCWVVGIGACIGTFLLIRNVAFVPEEAELSDFVYVIFFWFGFPILGAVGVVMMVLRPIFVLALCDLYSDYLEKKGMSADLPEDPPKSISAFVAFICLCLILSVFYLYHDEFGFAEILSTPNQGTQASSTQ